MIHSDSDPFRSQATDKRASKKPNWYSNETVKKRYSEQNKDANSIDTAHFLYENYYFFLVVLRTLSFAASGVERRTKLW